VARLSRVLVERYGVLDAAAGAASVCARCGYPTPAVDFEPATGACPGCATKGPP